MKKKHPTAAEKMRSFRPINGYRDLYLGAPPIGASTKFAYQ